MTGGAPVCNLPCVEPYYTSGPMTLYHGDCVDVLRGLPEGSVDSVVTDPPYELNFMGNSWDRAGVAFSRELWSECLRVLKPGGHLLAFGAPRTWHRMVCAVEDAGFQIRDAIMWLHGEGFPKGQNVDGMIRRQYPEEPELAAAWEGWNTALKPGCEPCAVAQKPVKGTVAGNVLEHGVGAYNVDACRVLPDGAQSHGLGRHPPNVALCVDTAAELDAATDKSVLLRWPNAGNARRGYNEGWGLTRPAPASADFEDSPNRSRTFPVFKYQPKARPHERPNHGGVEHPTVKPLELIRWLTKLVTPPGGLVLDPFAGSGTTGEAAIIEGFKCTLIECETSYLPLIIQRVEKPLQISLLG